MRPRLLSTRREKPGRPERRNGQRRARARRAERRQRAANAGFGETAVATEPRPAVPPAPPPAASPLACDPAVEKVRRAGGPLDEAVYSCACGYLFSAAVSTTVCCPQCGTGQAW